MSCSSEPTFISFSSSFFPVDFSPRSFCSHLVFLLLLFSLPLFSSLLVYFPTLSASFLPLFLHLVLHSPCFLLSSSRTLIFSLPFLARNRPCFLLLLLLLTTPAFLHSWLPAFALLRVSCRNLFLYAVSHLVLDCDGLTWSVCYQYIYLYIFLYPHWSPFTFFFHSLFSLSPHPCLSPFPPHPFFFLVLLPILLLLYQYDFKVQFPRLSSPHVHPKQVVETYDYGGMFSQPSCHLAACGALGDTHTHGHMKGRQRFGDGGNDMDHNSQASKNT